MSFQQKNISVSLVNFSLILVYFLIRIFLMVQDGSFLAPNVFRLWGDHHRIGDRCDDHRHDPYAYRLNHDRGDTDQRRT